MLHLLIEIPKTNFDKWFFISRSGNLKWIFNEILKINLNKYGFEGVIYVLYNLCNDGIIISRVAMFSTKWCHPKNLVTVASISGDCITDNDLNSASAASKSRLDRRRASVVKPMACENRSSVRDFDVIGSNSIGYWPRNLRLRGYWLFGMGIGAMCP